MATAQRPKALVRSQLAWIVFWRTFGGGGEFESALGYVARLGESTTTSTDQQLEVGQFKELAEGNANRACIVARSGVSDVSGGDSRNTR